MGGRDEVQLSTKGFLFLFLLLLSFLSFSLIHSLSASVFVEILEMRPSLSSLPSLSPNHWGPGQTSQHITFSFPISFPLPSSDELRIIHVYCIYRRGLTNNTRETAIQRE
ncbi:hypothetical protein I7I53_05302 [Histoplasma capsulatum var. duboisii H88]|uniref:Uncharacterized protein n=1 Tax=Ajellomyces capsulatus (strain H88) TaxID=544711 RepID=A0A8A1LUI9_AJEC8|nr:hypothetical protein I7I53_05302 [Histoplasma capsulatum var. duboisii H88]